MNAACALVANKKMGSVPFLIKDGETGLIYTTYKELEEKVKLLINNKELRCKLGKNAYTYITEKWTGSVAANNLIELFDSIINKKEYKIKEGPASKEEGRKNGKKKI